MPSSRRSLPSSCSPSPTTPRSSSRRNGPYPPMATRSQATAALNAARRPSRSETTHRQVLADIEWWRVVRGQEPTQDEPITAAGQEDTLMTDTAPPSPMPIDDMENIDNGSGNDMASPQYILTVPSTPASSRSPSRGTTPPRGEMRRAPTARSVSMGALEMMLYMNRTTSDEMIISNDHPTYPSTTFDASSRRI